MNKIKTKYLHIAIIILGIMFVSISIFHKNLWFDEAYTVGIVSKSFQDIWTIGSSDVHPVLYYWILHIFYLIFGSNIYIYRFISMIPLAILSVLGYTHIKKDFGEKVGFLFSFLILFLPIGLVYAGEVRMYTWAMLFVSLMAIYAYRIYKRIAENKETEQSNKIKNWVLFTIFSLASCYTHYYGLATAGVMNAVLFIYLIFKTIKLHKENKENKIFGIDLKCFIIAGVAQVLIYLPWFFAAVLGQIKGLSNGFWIPKPSPEIFMQIYIFQFTGVLDVEFVSKEIAIIFASIIAIYAIYCLVNAVYARFKGKELSSNKAGLLAIGVYFLVMACILIISIKKPILYARYFLNLTGLFIFFLAFFIAKGGRKILTVIVGVIIVVMSVTINCSLIDMNYDASNPKPLEYIEKDLAEGDMILFDNRGSGFVISMQLIYVPNCFYDKEQWHVEEAYKAFGKDMLTINNLESLKEYKGRIWLVTSDNYWIYDEFVDTFGKEDIDLIKQDSFDVKYHGYKYTICLIEKK